MIWQDSKKVICLNYKEYSCGRFVSNILSYNKNFLPLYNLDDTTPIEQYKSISYKHEVISKTIPIDKNLNHWRLYELKCDHFYGLKIEYDQKLIEELFHIPTQQVKKIPLQRLCELIKPRAKLILQNTNYFVFFTTHDDYQLKLVQAIFPNTIVIQLINDEYINLLSKKIKSITNVFKTKASYDANFTLNDSYLKFDIGTMFDKIQFFAEVNRILNTLECEDTSLSPLVFEYYEKYISIYKTHLNTN